MKNNILKAMIIVFFAVIASVSCNSSVRAVTQNSGTEFPAYAEFSHVIEIEWKLTEVRINGTNSGFNRSSLSAHGFHDDFTLTFDADFISGAGSPNRYSAPYTLNDGYSISIMLIRSTMMASIFEPVGMREHDFFQYLQNAYEWRLVNNCLELLSKTADGDDVILVFGR